MGNKRVRRHGLHMSTIESSVLVFNPHVTLVQSAEPQWSEVDVPDPVVDLLQSDVLADTDRRDLGPAAVSANAAVPTDVPDFEAIGILGRWQPVWHRRAATGRSTPQASPRRFKEYGLPKRTTEQAPRSRSLASLDAGPA